MNFDLNTWKISDLLKVYEENRLDLSPPYQRNEVWTAKAQQKLLESILKGKPIPSFFLLKKADNSFEMIDGQQRARTVIGHTPLKYYVMENADSDLSRFLEQNELQFPQKVMLCSELLKILKGLHALGIYHRDIKPQNILMRGGSPVFGDLGLISFRDEDSALDEFDEKIGPIGYLSPEATNKCLGLRTKPSFTFDCTIDAASDIFQLGQVFWFVVQDEVPTGHLIPNDLRFVAGGPVLEHVIRPMLQYGKTRRASLGDVETALQPVLREMAIT